MTPPLTDPLEALFQHEIGEVANETALLGDGDELVGHDVAVLTVGPPGEGLDRDDVTGDQVDLRLEVRLDLAAFDGVPEVSRERQALGAVRVIGAVVEHGAEVLALRDVHRDVGLPQHGRPVDGRAVGIGDGDADARGDVDTHVGDLHRLLDDGFHVGSDLRDCLDAAVGDHEDGELVSTEPRHHEIAVGSEEVQPPGEFCQQLVAVVVTERVVHFLEVVDVDQRDRDDVGTGAVGEGPTGLQVEHHTVRQRGERVVQRFVFPLGDLVTELIDELGVLQRNACMVHEHLEEAPVGLGERDPAVRRNAKDGERAGRPLQRRLERSLIIGLDAAEPVGVTVGVTSGRQQRERLRRDAATVVGVERPHALGAGGTEAPRIVTVGQRHRELRHLGPEQIERLVEHAADRAFLGPHEVEGLGGLVEAVQPLVVVEQGDVVAVDDHQDDGECAHEPCEASVRDHEAQREERQGRIDRSDGHHHDARGQRAAIGPRAPEPSQQRDAERTGHGGGHHRQRCAEPCRQRDGSRLGRERVEDHEDHTAVEGESGDVEQQDRRAVAQRCERDHSSDQVGEKEVSSRQREQSDDEGDLDQRCEDDGSLDPESEFDSVAQREREHHDPPGHREVRHERAAPADCQGIERNRDAERQDRSHDRAPVDLSPSRNRGCRGHPILFGSPQALLNSSAQHWRSRPHCPVGSGSNGPSNPLQR